MERIFGPAAAGCSEAARQGRPWRHAGRRPPRNACDLPARDPATSRSPPRAFLASAVGSVSPYIGLLGTVWGIMNSFRGLSQRQAATPRAGRPGIAESLVATAIGLRGDPGGRLQPLRARIDRLGIRFESFMEFSTSCSTTCADPGEFNRCANAVSEPDQRRAYIDVMLVLGDLHGHRADDPTGAINVPSASPGTPPPQSRPSSSGQGRRSTYALRASNSGTSRPVRREQFSHLLKDALAKNRNNPSWWPPTAARPEGDRRARDRARRRVRKSAWSPRRDFAEMRIAPHRTAASRQASGSPSG